MTFLRRQLFDKVLFYSIILLFLLTPSFYLPGISFPIRILDLLLPFVCLSIFFNKWYRQYIPLLIGGLISLWILFTILVNHTYDYLPNFIEIYKVVKLTLYFLFFKNMLPDIKSERVWDILFCVFVLINFLHYFDIFSFNSTVMPWWCGENNKNLVFFGLDSAGNPFCKRMIGTLGNPNKNATIFLFFSVLYAPKSNWSRKNLLFFFITLIAIYACQSRTCFIAFCFIYLFNLIFTTISWKQKLWQTVAIIALFVFLFNVEAICQKIFGLYNPQISSEYIGTVIDGEAFGGTSFGKRMETWSFFGEKLLHKPVVGYSPDLLFFNNHGEEIYSENDFVQNAYRYGFVGLLILLLLYFIPFLQAIKQVRYSVKAKQLCQTVILFGIVSLAYDVMLHQTVIPILYIYMLADFYAQPHQKDLWHCIKRKKNVA